MKIGEFVGNTRSGILDIRVTVGSNTTCTSPVSVRVCKVLVEGRLVVKLCGFCVVLVQSQCRKLKSPANQEFSISHDCCPV